MCAQIENFSTLLEAIAINYHGIVGELDFEALLSVSAVRVRVIVGVLMLCVVNSAC